MAQTAERRIHGTDHEFNVPSLQRQHLRVAKRLRDYRVARIQITETHGLKLVTADCRLSIGFRFHVAIEMAQTTVNSQLPEESLRLDSALDVGRSMFEVFCSYEKRTSLPGSI